jgi:hypothetical protein
MRRFLPEILVLLGTLVIPGSAQAGLFEVSCEATLTNDSPYILRVTNFSAHHRGWKTNIVVGKELRPGQSLSGSISDAPMKCGATVWFSDNSGRTFKATFHNPWNSSSSWECQDITTAPIVCVIDGNRYGQPLRVKFSIRGKRIPRP